MTHKTLLVVAAAALAFAVFIASEIRPAAQSAPPVRGTAAAGQALYKAQCAACHDDAASRAPSKEVLAAKTHDAIVAALKPGGVMAVQGEGMADDDRLALARFLAPAGSSVTDKPVLPPLGGGAPAANFDPTVGLCGASAKPMGNPASGAAWNGWGNGTENARFQPAAAAGLTAADVPKLQLKWAFGFPGTTQSSGQPAIAGGRVFVGNSNGFVYALDAETGCTHWTFKAAGGVRTAISAGPTPNAPGKYSIYFGDIRANVYALDAATGTQLWQLKVDEHAFARITGAPTLAGDRLIVTVSSIEETAGARPNYACCTFRGSVLSIDVATGRTQWQTFMTDPPKEVGKKTNGTAIFKPAGAAIWTAPTIDAPRGVVYVATGNAYTEPAAPLSDAIVALDLKTGAIQWANQVTPGDVYVIGCKPGIETCPDDMGPDHDFGNSPILRTLPGGRRVLLAGQKSGVMWALDPDNKGKVLWQFRAAKGGPLGGLEWGSAADDRQVYVPVSDVLLPIADQGGLFALNIADGKQVWHAKAPALNCTGGPGCNAAQSAAISVIPGAVFSGSVDGHLRAYSTTDGSIIWAFNTMRDFETVNGVKASGGSIDSAGPVIAGGLVLTNSGYGAWRGKAGNVLLAFAVK